MLLEFANKVLTVNEPKNKKNTSISEGVGMFVADD